MTDRPNVPDSVIEKVRKLLAHAESAKALGSIAEAAAFAAKASDILAQHKIGMSDLELMAEGESDKQGHEMYDHLHRRGRVAWYERMALAICRANFCHMTVVTGSSRIGLTGRDSDRTIAAYLIQTLTATGERLAQAHSRQVMAQYRETLKAFQNQGPSGEWRPYPMKPSNPKLSFLAGYQSAITERLAEQRKQQQAHNPNAIIRLTNALKESNDHAKSIMPNLRSARMAGGPRSQDAGSKAAGYAAGRGANLSGGIGAGGQVGARMRLGAGAS